MIDSINSNIDSIFEEFATEGAYIKKFIGQAVKTDDIGQMQIENYPLAVKLDIVNLEATLDDTQNLKQVWSLPYYLVLHATESTTWSQILAAKLPIIETLLRLQATGLYKGEQLLPDNTFISVVQHRQSRVDGAKDKVLIPIEIQVTFYQEYASLFES